MSAEYPVRKDVIDISVARPTRSYDLVDVDLEKQYTIRRLWPEKVHPRRAQNVLNPQIVLTGDRKNIPFNIAEQWTPISVFAKIIGKNMAVKVYVEDHQVKFVPSADNSVRMM